MKAIETSLDRKILSYAINHKKFTVELNNVINAEYFDDSLKWLFEIICRHFNDPQFKEVPTESIIEEYLKKAKYSEQEIESLKNTYNEIKSIQADQAEFTWLIQKIKIRYNDFIQKEAMSKIAQLKDDEDKVEKINKIIKESTFAIDSIYKQQIYSEGLLKDSAVDRWKKYKEIEENPQVAQGILTGLKQFDKVTNGFQRGEMIIIVGNTGGGKSVLMQNIAINAWLGKNNPLMADPLAADDSGHNILYFSLEMPKLSQERRIDACIGELYYAQIRDGLLSQEDKEKYAKILKFQAKYKKNFYVVDLPKGCSVRDVEVKFLEVSDNIFKPDMVVVDYLGIMSSNGGDSDWLALGKISEELHEFARVHNVVTLTAAQANRAPKEAKVKYNTDRVGRSDLISHNANVIMQIERRDDEDIRIDMNVHLTKVRDGSRGMFVLSKDFAKMKVRDMMDESIDDGYGDDI